MAAPRIISLLSSATEIAVALGLEPYLVGRSHECDWPPSIAHLPVCSQPRIDPDLPSGEIDRQVRTAMATELSVYQVDVDQLRDLRPTHILTQTQCEVCAVSLNDVTSALKSVAELNPTIVSLHPMRLEHLWQNIAQVAGTFALMHRAEKLIQNLGGRLEEMEDRSIPLSTPNVACIEWLDPLMVAGNWVPQLVSIAGGHDLLGQPGEHSPWLTWQELHLADPDLLVIMPCGFSLDRTRAEMSCLQPRTEWRSLRAVQNGEVYLVDGNQYFNRPGPRLVESAEILAEIFHPDQFDFGHQGTGWERWTPAG